MLALITQFCIVTSNDGQEFCLRRFTFQKLRNNHSNKDYVTVFAALVYSFNFFIKLLCFSRGNLNNILGNIPHEVGSWFVTCQAQDNGTADCMYLTPVCCSSSCKLWLSLMQVLLFSVVTSAGARGNSLNLCQGRFGENFSQKVFVR